MNVMTVGDVPAEVTVKIQTNDQSSTQDFASELDRASSKDYGAAEDVKNVQKADNKAQADDRPEIKKTDDQAEDQTEEQKKIHGMQPVQVIINMQNTEGMTAETMQGAVQNTDGSVPEITILETPSQGAAHNAEQVAIPNAQAQYLPENAMQNPKAQDAAQKPASETGKTQNEPVLQETPKNVSGNMMAAQATLDNAEAFAGQALREIADLQKAQARMQPKDGQQAKDTLSAMQQTLQQATQTAEQASGQNVLQQDGQQTGQNTLAGAIQTETTAKEPTVGGETKQNAQDGSAKQESVVTQMQTTFGTSGTKVEFQQAAQAPEQPVVRQTVMTTIIDTISTAFGKETTDMVVQLKPEHLGGLSISLSMGESGLVAKMVTSEQSVHNMIHGEIGMLQEALREKGIPVVHMEVSWGQTTNTSANSQRENGGYGTTPSYTGNHAAYDNTEEPVNYYYNLSHYDLLTEQGGSVEFSA